MSRFPEIEIVATSLVNKDEYIRQAIDQRRVDKFWKLSARQLQLCVNFCVAQQRVLAILLPLYCTCLQCFDAVGWAAGRASGL